MADRWAGEFDEGELPQDEEFSGPDLEEELRLGAACNKLLHSPEYRVATAGLRDTILEAYTTSPLRDSEGHTYCRLMLKCLEDIEQMLQNTVNTGKMAMAQLDEQEASFKEAQIQ